jgi:hypothetical protein
MVEQTGRETMTTISKEMFDQKLDETFQWSAVAEGDLSEKRLEQAFASAGYVFNQVMSSPAADDEGFVPEEVVFANNKSIGTTLKCPHCKLDLAVVKA